MYKYFVEEDFEKQSEKPSDFYEHSASTKACKYFKFLKIFSLFFFLEQMNMIQQLFHQILISARSI